MQLKNLNWKDEFIKEVNKIYDQNLKDVALIIVEKIPEYFWEIPASSSGKYHPECDQGSGGLVRHSIMVSKVVDDLITGEMFCRDNTQNRDIAKFATLFHDCCKNGFIKEDGTYEDHTIHEHPLIASDFIRKILVENKIDQLKIEMICDGIRTHMGKWCVSRYSDVALSKPRTDFERLIHLADYVASRTYIKGLPDWIEDSSVSN